MSENQRRPPKRSSGTVITILIIVLIGALYLGWGYISGSLPWQESQEKAPPQIIWLEKDSDAKEAAQQGESGLPIEKEQAILHLAPGETQPAFDSPNECLQTADKILLFFEHLDRQDYIREFTINGSTLDHMTGIINKLMANPPVVVRETDDLFAILHNMAHFFRILGPKDILLIKDVLINEQELVEPTLALFYKWSEIEPECTDKELNINLPLAGLYEYAGYFINTLGGQSYLFRRALYLRLLIRYYSILIIDRANNVDANRYGIDIRYTLSALISELQTNADLENSQDYLENLINLLESYQAKYGN
ncbi:hypothetical protein ACFLZQ_05435 [Thermodesulfobacteriota bacterium]